ncbi:MFS transporter [Sodalis sp. RH20]|uniref:MFS transporter n=1 Tax=unclassified Sodalis (in: enterobacteria) TaxID=2636512 RepID=UPI0039B5C48A
MASMTGQGHRAAARDPLWTSRFVLLLVSAVFMYMMTFMLTPTLPLFVQDIGAGTTAAGGVIVAGYTVGSLLPRLMWGSLADSWGRRPVYLLGVAIMAVISPLFTVAGILPVIISLRLVQGVGFSASSTGAATVAADLVPASRRSEGIGYYALANTIGMAAGPNLGLMIHQQWGANWLFIASVASGLVAIITGLWIGDRRRGRQPKVSLPTSVPDPVVSPRGWERLLEKSVLRACAVLLFVVMPYGAIMAYVAAYGIHQGVTHIGLYFTVFALALLVVRLGVGRITDRFGATIVFVPGVAAMLAGLLVLGWADGLTVFLTSAALFGLGYGVALPLLQSITYAIAPEDRRGVASATFFATADIGYGLGAVLLGVSISLLGYRIAFAGLALLVAIALMLFLILLHPQRRRRQDG